MLAARRGAERGVGSLVSRGGSFRRVVAAAVGAGPCSRLRRCQPLPRGAEADQTSQALPERETGDAPQLRDLTKSGETLYSRTVYVLTSPSSRCPRLSEVA